jgi:tRNA pseudouridine55 synthase
MHAVVNLDKPRGLTSRKAMELARKALNTRKAGHAGSLDPIATGVLLVLLGEATKLSDCLMDLEKEYSATVKLGERTDTMDAEGAVVERVEDFSVTGPEVEKALQGFRGEIEQVPPMYSALKVSGTSLYKLARKGVEVERKPRRVLVSELELLGLEGPCLRIRIVCSKGTYIRTLADDIGRALGTGGHISSLRRLRVGHFRAGEAAAPEDLHPGHPAVHSVDSALAHLREITLGPKEYSLALHGAPFIKNKGLGLRQGELLRLKDPRGEVFAVGVCRGEKVRVRRLLHLKA